MFARILITVVALGVLASIGVGDDAKKDLQWMQGHWELTELIIDGKKVDVLNLGDAKAEIKNNVFAVTLNNQNWTALLKLDASKKPKEIDLNYLNGPFKDKACKGIYLHEKDAFKICRNLNPDQDRPTEFASPAQSGVFIITWKRPPKKDK